RGERGAEPAPGRRAASRASGGEGTGRPSRRGPPPAGAGGVISRPAPPRLEEAQSLADRAVESLPGPPGFTAHALHLLGDIATHPDRFDAERGEAHYRQALALAEPRGMRPLVAHCHLALGTLHRRTGQREPAQEHLTIATTMYREMGMTYWLEKAEAEAEAAGEDVP